MFLPSYIFLSNPRNFGVASSLIAFVIFDVSNCSFNERSLIEISSRSTIVSLILVYLRKTCSSIFELADFNEIENVFSFLSCFAVIIISFSSSPLEQINSANSNSI